MLKNKKIKHKWYFLVGIGGVIMITIWLYFLTKQISPTQEKIAQSEEIIPGSTSLITPTILTNKNNNKFIHPQNHFSFEYPKEWHLELTRRNVSQPFYQVILTNKINEKKFIIYFSSSGRDYPAYREVIEYKNLGEKNIKWVTLYNQDKAVEAFTQFTDNEFGNNLIGLYIYLPEENQEEFIKQVEDIIASLE